MSEENKITIDKIKDHKAFFDEIQDVCGGSIDGISIYPDKMTITSVVTSDSYGDDYTHYDDTDIYFEILFDGGWKSVKEFLKELSALKKLQHDMPSEYQIEQSEGALKRVIDDAKYAQSYKDEKTKKHAELVAKRKTEIAKLKDRIEKSKYSKYIKEDFKKLYEDDKK